MIDLGKYLKVRDTQHELELALMEERLAEYVGLRTELEIRREADLLRTLKGFKLLGLEKWGYKEPPKMRGIMPRATTDWDFSDTYWELDPSIYVSAPSSLRIQNAHLINSVRLCKYAGTYPLNQGRVVTQVRIIGGDGTRTFGWRFRSNNAPGTSVVTADCYLLHECQNLRPVYDATKATLGYFTIGTYSDLKVGSYLANGAPTFGSFEQRRITWWISAGVMMFRLERYYGGEWIKAITDMTDTNNRFTGNANRRCGFGGGYARDARIDDTEIWGP